MEKTDIFNFEIPKSIEGIDSKILNPRNTWSDKQLFDRTLKNLAQQFQKNFDYFNDVASDEIKNAGPKL